MAKKNKSNKKHRFKYAEPATGVSQVPAVATVTASSSDAPAGNSATPKAAAAAVSTVAGRDFSYVSTDLRRLSVLAVGLVALELVLWYLFTHTGIGDAVFNLIHV